MSSSDLVKILCSSLDHEHVETQIPDHKHQEVRNEIKRDISSIQLSSDKNLFDHSIKLFFDKWRILASEEVNTFLDYFSNEWVRETTNTVTGKKLVIINGMKEPTNTVVHQVIV